MCRFHFRSNLEKCTGKMTDIYRIFFKIMGWGSMEEKIGHILIITEAGE